MKSKSYVKLGDLVDEITVGWVGTMSNEYVDEGIPFLRSLNVKPYEISFKNMKFISKEFHEKIKKSALHPGDVVVVRTGNAGTASLISDELQIANCSDLVIIRPGEKIDANFLVSYLNSKSGIDNIAGRLVGSVQRHFNIGDAKSLEIPNISIDTQKKISNILTTLKNKIAILENQNRTLEQMAQTVFKSWFVDFDGVTEWDDSELGQIPKGWSVEALDENINFLNGIALQKFRPNNEEFLPAIKIKEMKEGFSDKTEKVGLHINPKYIIKNGDILFSWSGSLELTVWHRGDGALNQHIFKVTSEKYKKWFYYQWVKSHLPEFKRIAEGKVTTMGHIQRYHLAEAKILVPSPKTLEKYNLLFQPLFNQILSNRLESELLTKTRDILLPKLMSGEIRV